MSQRIDLCAMDTWILLAALVLAVIAAVQGAICVHFDRRSKWTIGWLLASFVCQLIVLSIRGQMRGSCPLEDTGEVMLFSAWSLTMCYLAVGSVYRLSLLGVFTAPLVSFLLGVAIFPGMMEAAPEHASHPDAWRAFHAGFSVLAYGALGLSAVAAAMFIVLNQQLKDAHLTTGLFKKLPPARELIFVVRRLLVLGLIVLTLGVFCGVMMERNGVEGGGINHHLLMAVVLWASYGGLLLVTRFRGLPPKKLALSSIVLFVVSLLMFFVI